MRPEPGTESWSWRGEGEPWSGIKSKAERKPSAGVSLVFLCSLEKKLLHLQLQGVGGQREGECIHLRSKVGRGELRGKEITGTQVG